MRAAFDPLRLRALIDACLVPLQLALTAFAVSACAPRAPAALAGASDAWAHADEPRPVSTAAPPKEWDAYAEVVKWAPVNAAPFLARGHQPEQLADVRISAESRATYLGLVVDHTFPDGTLIAELPHEGAREARFGYAMRKSAGVWSFFQLDSQGGLLSSGTPLSCQLCHAQALADHVFGLPQGR